MMPRGNIELKQIAITFAFLAAILVVLGASGFAQFGPPLIAPPRELGSDLSPTRRLPREHLTQTAFLKAESALKSGKITEGLQTLQEILDHDGDFFVAEDRAAPVSLFSLIEGQFRKHHEEYERLYGAAAQQVLNDARTQQNLLQLEELIRRFELTQAGAAGLQLLSQIEEDNGNIIQAVRSLERLALHPGTENPRANLEAAVRLLTSCGERSRAKDLLARHANIFKDPADQKLLDVASTRSERSSDNTPNLDWRMPYSGVSHLSKSLPAPAFTEVAWRSPLIDDTYDFWLLDAPEMAKRLGDDTRGLMQSMQRRLQNESNRPAMPAAQPIAIHGLVIAPGPGSVKAFDAESGKLVWNGLVIDETFDYLAKWSYSAGESQDTAREEMRNLFSAMRGWRDLTSNSISTDGQRVYSITGCQLVGTTSPMRMLQNTQRHPLLPQRSNRLIAYDLKTEGKIAWPLGTHLTSANTDLDDPREIFFLGAPLPVQGHLYVLGEERGQVQLYELDPETGSILWSIGLLNPDRDLVLDDARRLSGLMPAYSDGLLICPTGEGTLTAVDPLRRRVEWTHFYASLPSPQQTQTMMMRVIRPQNLAASHAREELLSDKRWFDSRVMVSGNYVIFTPPDDDALICLKLHDGTPVFNERIQRGQALYAATVYEDELILVGRSEITSIHLTGGTSRWKRSIPIPLPSGRGVRMDSQFLQPLQTGEIAVIDLPTGRLLTRLPVTPGEPVGNLAAAEGQLFVQTSTSVGGFRSRQWLDQAIATAMKDDATRGVAQGLRGAWKLQQGQLESGLKDLKQASIDSKQTGAQSILIWSLLDGLRTDFATYRSEAERLEPTLQGADQRLQFLKTFGRGLQLAGEPIPAFRDYLKILSLLPANDSVQDVDSQWGATSTRWSLARMEEILQQADEPTRASLLQQLQSWAEKAPVESLLRLLPAFPDDWLPARTKIALLTGKTFPSESRHNLDAILHPLLKHEDPMVRVNAAALLLPMARSLGDVTFLQELLTILESESLTLAGQSGTSSELALATRTDPQFVELMAQKIEWKLPIHVGESQIGTSRSSLMQIPRLGPTSAALEGWSFFLDQAGGNVEIFDAQGRHRERIPTGLPSVRYFVESELARYVTFHDHFAMVVLLDRILLIDFLTDSNQPQLVLNRSTTGEVESVGGRAPPLSGHPRTGLRTSIIELGGGRVAGNASQITRTLVCLTNGTDLIALSPRNGRELWHRRDITPGSEVFGDDRYIVVKPPDEQILKVYRALDGEYLFQRALPDSALTSLERLNGDWGRFVPVRIMKQSAPTWQLYDPVQDQIVWSHSAPAGSRWTIVEGRDVAFATPDRELTVFDGLIGKKRYQFRIPQQQEIEDLAVFEFPEQVVLCTSNSRTDAIRRQTFGVRSQDLIMSEVNGLVCSFDRKDGRVQWSKEIQNQSVLAQFPREWPILLFARGRGRLESLILNRQTGEELRRNSAADDESGISWLTETHPLRLHLKFGQDRTTLYFGEKPPSFRTPHAPTQTESLR